MGDKLLEATGTMYQMYGGQKLSVILVIVYFVLSCVQFVLDMIVFFYALVYVKNDFDENSYPGALILALSSVFMSLDLYYIIWVLSFKFKMPSDYSTEIITALMGFPIKMKKRFGSSEPVS